MSAWNEACALTTPSKIVIPPGTYLLGEITLQGPCKAPLELNLQGTLKAPPENAQFKQDGWVTLQYLDQITMSGGGVFDGQGKTAWRQNDCNANSNCRKIIVSLLKMGYTKSNLSYWSYQITMYLMDEQNLRPSSKASPRLTARTST